MNKVMILWVGDPIGPNMGEAPSNSRRNHLAAKAMRIFDISNYKAKAQAFLEGKDAQLEDRLRACANTADKVRIVLHRVFFAFHVPCLQYNRKLTRDAVNQFFTGDPTQHPDLAAVHKAMGLCGTRKVLHRISRGKTWAAIRTGPRKNQHPQLPQRRKGFMFRSIPGPLR